jgi:hypothetical protein
MRLLTVVLVLAFAAPAAAQSRAGVLAAEFNKTKDVTKSKRGVTLHKYHEVHASPLSYNDIGQYAGHYASEPLALDITVLKDGRVRAVGRDESRSFEVRDAKISGALLSGTKVYAGGKSEAFEAVFLIRRDRDDPKAAFTVMTGLGYFGDVPASWGISSPQHIFLTKR